MVLLLEGGADRRGDVFGGAGAMCDTDGPERDEVADEIVLPGREQRDDRRRGAQLRQPANGVRHRQIGGPADHDEIGAFGRGNAHRLPSRVRLGDHVDALRVQHGDDAEAGEGQLVGHERASVVGVVVQPAAPPRASTRHRTDGPTERAPSSRKVVTSFSPAVYQALRPPATKRLASGEQPSGTGGNT